MADQRLDQLLEQYKDAREAINDHKLNDPDEVRALVNACTDQKKFTVYLEQFEQVYGTSFQGELKTKYKKAKNGLRYLERKVDKLFRDRLYQKCSECYKVEYEGVDTEEQYLIHDENICYACRG